LGTKYKENPYGKKEEYEKFQKIFSS